MLIHFSLPVFIRAQHHISIFIFLCFWFSIKVTFYVCPVSGSVIIMSQTCRPLVFWGQSREYIYIKVDISEITSVSNNFVLAASLGSVLSVSVLLNSSVGVWLNTASTTWLPRRPLERRPVESHSGARENIIAGPYYPPHSVCLEIEGGYVGRGVPSPSD